MGRSQSDKQRRTDEVMYFVEDVAAGNIHYYGRTDTFAGLTSEAIWQIKRVYRSGDDIITTYANDGKYNCVWDDRATYFPAAVAGAPYLGNILLDEDGNPYSSSNPLDVTANFSGLKTGGLVTEVTLSSVAWTALPATALVNRNAMCIQNISAVEIKLNYATPGGYTGVVVPTGTERFYDITDSIVIYARAQAGSPVIVVEEIA